MEEFAKIGLWLRFHRRHVSSLSPLISAANETQQSLIYSLERPRYIAHAIMILQVTMEDNTLPMSQDQYDKAFKRANFKGDR